MGMWFVSPPAGICICYPFLQCTCCRRAESAVSSLLHGWDQSLENCYPFLQCTCCRRTESAVSAVLHGRDQPLGPLEPPGQQGQRGHGLLQGQDRSVCKTEMEFLDINLTKDLSLLLHAVHSPFYRRISKKTILFSGFENHYKKIRETRKLKSVQE